MSEAVLGVPCGSGCREWSDFVSRSVRASIPASGAGVIMKKDP
jgi:hypothetical protein